MQEQPTAIPFILNSERGFYLTPEATTFLRGLTSPVGIITVVGKYRTGKSLFVNRVLLNNPNGFKVGPTVNPCTKGLWLWRETLRSDNAQFPDQEVLVIDSEGFGGTDENSNHDSKIMLFALLLSSFFIYNSVGSIDQNSLNCLNLIINLAKEIQAKANEEIDGYFPSFLWVIRDFTLQIVDKDGCPMGAKEYLEKALEMQKGVSDAIENKNKLRRMFKHFFKDRDCATLVRPVESETGLQNLNQLDESELRPEFVQQIKSLRKRIFKKVKPKSIRSRVLNGPMLVELAAAYLESVNSGGLPSVESAWTYVRRRASEQAVDLAVTQLQQKLDSSEQRLPEAKLKGFKKSLKNELLATFQKKAIGSEEELKGYQSILKEQFNRRFTQFCSVNLRSWVRYFQEVFEQASRDFRVQIEADRINTTQEFRKQLIALKQQFNARCEEGPGKSQFLKDMEIKLTNEHLYTMVASTESKKAKEVEFLNMRLEKVDEERRQDRKQTKQLQHRVWELQKDIACKEDELEGVSRRSEHITAGLKNELQRSQSQLLGRKSSEERLQGEAEYLKKLVEDSKLRLETLTSRLIEMEIAKKQLFEQNRNSLRELQNANFLISSKDEQLSRLNKQHQKTLQTLEREKQKQAKLSQSCTRLKVDGQLRQNQLADLREKYNRLLKEYDEVSAAKYDLNGQLRELRANMEALAATHQSQLEGLRAALEKEQSTKHELTETNKNLSSAVTRMELRTKQAQQKIEALKDYKKSIKNASCLQCQHCSKFVACAIFTQHLNLCMGGTETGGGQLLKSMQVSLQKTMQPHHPKQCPLEISITQTLVRQCDSKPYTQYVICLAKGTAKWNITRKYKAFCQLHNSLRIALPGITLSEVAYIVNPQQGNRKSLLIQQRRKLLQRYLRDISECQLVQRERCFITFMQLPKENDRGLSMSQAQSMLPQSPEQFLRSWNQRNQRLKETTGKRQALR